MPRRHGLTATGPTSRLTRLRAAAWRGWRQAATISGWLALLTLAACSEPATLTIDSLRLPLSEVPGAQRLEEKSALVVGDQQGDVAVTALRRQGISASAYYKYHLAGGGQYKLKVSIFEDAARRRAAWQRKYPPAVLAGTERRDWGESAFVIPDQVGAFSVGRINLEIEAGGGAKDLDAVLAACARRAAKLRH